MLDTNDHKITGVRTASSGLRSGEFDRPGPVSGAHCSTPGLDAAASGWLAAAACDCPSGSAFISTFTAAS